MKTAIILNGAPGAGKDTIGCILADTYDHVALRSFKAPMFEIARAILGEANYEYFMFLYSNSFILITVISCMTVATLSLK